MTTIARAHVLAALIWMIVGMVFGFWMGATNALQYRPFHIGMMLGGFLTLAMVGAIFRLWPEMESYRFAKLHFWTLELGVLGLNLGTLVQILTGNIAVLVVCSLLTMFGTALLIHGFVTATKPA